MSEPEHDKKDLPAYGGRRKGVHQEQPNQNFLIKVKTITNGASDEKARISTKGYMGAFRITIHPLDRGERGDKVVQITGFARTAGILEIRIGQADQTSGMEVGEQMVFETVRDLDAMEWLKEDYESPRRKARSGRRYKRNKAKTTSKETPTQQGQDA